MSYEIELITDEDGVAVIGDKSVVEQFLTAQGLQGRALDSPRFSSILNSAASVAQTGSTVSESSGRWVKLTKESAAAMNKSSLMKGSNDKVRRAILTEDGGKIKGILEIVTGPGAALSNPAVLAGAAGIMAQMAMQQTMDEITDYLAAIDVKVDDILRAQKDAVIADMIGVDLVLDEAMEIRGQVGRVSEITWSKAQSTDQTIKRTQAYALRQLDGLAENLEKTSKIGDLAEAGRRAEGEVREWVAVLAHCSKLQDAISVLELERVMDVAPTELDDHRRALQAARRRRIDHMSSATAALIERMDAAASVADAGLLLNPLAAPKVVQSRNRIHDDLVGFQRVLGLEAEQQALEGRRWTEAVVEARDKVVDTTSTGFEKALQVSGDVIDDARSSTGKVAGSVSRKLRRSSSQGDAAEDSDPAAPLRIAGRLPKLPGRSSK